MSARKILPVLIVEDSLEQRALYKYFIDEAAAKSGWTCDIQEASGVAKAKSILDTSFVPRLVFLDHRLPGENGLVFFRHLIERGLSCRVLVASSYLMTEDDTERQKVYEAYTKSEHGALSVELCEKNARKLENVEAHLKHAVAELTQPLVAGRQIKWTAFGTVVHRSPAMQGAKESIKSFLKGWQRDERQLLVLHGPAGAGKRFMAIRTAEALNIINPSAAFDDERARFKFDSAASVRRLLSLLTAANVYGAGLRLYSEPQLKLSSLPAIGDWWWSHIIPDMSRATNRNEIAPLVAETAISHFGQPLIMVCDESWWPELHGQLDQRMSSLMVAARIPLLSERSDDIPRLVQEIQCGFAKTAKAIPLGRVAEDRLRKYPPESCADLAYWVRLADQKARRRQAAEIAVSDFPRVPSIAVNVERPPRPAEISEESEKGIIKVLVELQKAARKPSEWKKKKLVFDDKFEQWPEIEKIVIRALAYSSADEVWRGCERKMKNGAACKMQPSYYPTIFGVTWAAVMNNQHRIEITEFARRHKGYCLWLAKFGPTQPLPD